MNKDIEELVERVKRQANELGVLKERNRVLGILIKYREAGWIDQDTAKLLAEDVGIVD